MQRFEEIMARMTDFEQELAEQKSSESDIPWYPYGTMSNFHHLKLLINDEMDALFSGGMRFADVGAADGDLAFYLESLGNSCSIFDYGPTNFNRLRGARRLKGIRHSSVEIIEVDLDDQFSFSGEFDVIFFLGIMYHLKNPFYALERFSKSCRYMFLSTRIARHFRAGTPDVSDFSAAYLLAADESNNDATNFWIFSEAGLKRIVHRAGWDVVTYRSVGDTATSNPQDADRDERAFCALKSRHFN